MPARATFTKAAILLVLAFFFWVGETERTRQGLLAIRSYVITSSASRWPRLRVRIERFYYDVDHLQADTASVDEHAQRVSMVGSFLVAANEIRGERVSPRICLAKMVENFKESLTGNMVLGKPITLSSCYAELN